MFAVEYAKNNTFVFTKEGFNREFFVSFLRKNKKILELEFESIPRLTLSKEGLLAITTRKTVFYNLNEDRITKPQFEKQGIWYLSSSGEELFTIASQNNPVKDPDTGKDVMGLITLNLKTNKIRIIHEQLKANPAGLFMAEDGNTWAAIDTKNKQYLFGEGNSTIGKFAWNKGQLGEMTENLLLDAEGKRIFVKHVFYKFHMISCVDFDGKIKSFKSEKRIFSLPARINDKWAIVAETETKTSSIVISVKKESTSHLYFFNVDSMQIEGKLREEPFSGSNERVVKQLYDGQVAVFDKNGYKLLGASDSEQSGKGLSDDEYLKNSSTNFLSLAGEFDKLFKPDDLFVKYLNYAESKGYDLQYAQLDDCLSLSILPVLSLGEHRFIGLVPDAGCEFNKWSVAEFDEGWGYIDEVHEAKDRDLCLFMENAKIENPAQAWNFFTSLWVTHNVPIVEAAKMIVQHGYNSDSIFFPFIEAIAMGSKNTFSVTLENAAHDLEKSGDIKNALYCCYNALAGNEFDVKWNEDLLSGLLRCSEKIASQSFKCYCGLLLKRLKHT